METPQAVQVLARAGDRELGGGWGVHHSAPSLAPGCAVPAWAARIAAPATVKGEQRGYSYRCGLDHWRGVRTIVATRDLV